MCKRRLEILRLLRRGRTTAWVLAARLGTSLRTVYRDIAALRSDGYDVAAVGGRRGGFWLAPGTRAAPLTLDAEQIRELVVALSALPTPLPTLEAPSLITALLQAVPESRADQMRGLLDGRGRTSGFRANREYALEATDPLSCIEKSIAYKRLLWLWQRGARTQAHTILEPERIELRSGEWWLTGVEQTTREAQEIPLACIERAAVKIPPQRVLLRSAA